MGRRIQWNFSKNPKRGRRVFGAIEIWNKREYENINLNLIYCKLNMHFEIGFLIFYFLHFFFSLLPWWLLNISHIFSHLIDFPSPTLVSPLLKVSCPLPFFVVEGSWIWHPSSASSFPDTRPPPNITLPSCWKAIDPSFLLRLASNLEMFPLIFIFYFLH